MAGKAGRSGRKPGSVDVKLALGTYRPDRSGDPDAIPRPGGVPEKPRFTNPWADQLWDSEVVKLIEAGMAEAIDAPMLRSMCELWGLYRASYEAAESDPTDKDMRISVISYWTKFEVVSSRFGMNISDRQRLKVGGDKPQGVRRRQQA